MCLGEILLDNNPIGIFDSGLGGLTVMKEVISQLPNENIVYFGDTARVPYGTRSHETIKKYALQDANFLLKNDVKVIVAACGTVSAVASGEFKDYKVPYFEMITPAAIAAVKATKTNKIGVIGTPATIKSCEHKHRILELLPAAQIFANACPLFVPLVEEGITDSNNFVLNEIAKKYLLPLKEQNIDTLILGCTHYPILSDVISKIMGNKITLINPGEELAFSLKNYLTDNDLCAENKTPKHNFFVSDMTVSFQKTARFLLDENINELNAKQVDINKI